MHLHPVKKRFSLCQDRNSVAGRSLLFDGRVIDSDTLLKTASTAGPRNPFTERTLQAHDRRLAKQICAQWRCVSTPRKLAGASPANMKFVGSAGADKLDDSEAPKTT
jgi:hypothetical protein